MCISTINNFIAHDLGQGYELHHGKIELSSTETNNLPSLNSILNNKFDGLKEHKHIENNCCDEKDSYLPNIYFSIFIPILIFFIQYWFSFLSGSLFSYLDYYNRPPPEFNYPQKYVVNCTYLN
ncbi:hypothetical protein GCM10022277_26940 [Litoribacillus peritrichatus]|uniref:PIR Superfamily Protein n=1 Tax=Litoribacillus peritrichatus TaxID=718191 RepID=A0ABP7MRX8_9GAMM